MKKITQILILLVLHLVAPKVHAVEVDCALANLVLKMDEPAIKILLFDLGIPKNTVEKIFLYKNGENEYREILVDAALSSAFLITQGEKFAREVLRMRNSSIYKEKSNFYSVFFDWMTIGNGLFPSRKSPDSLVADWIKLHSSPFPERLLSKFASIIADLPVEERAVNRLAEMARLQAKAIVRENFFPLKEDFLNVAVQEFIDDGVESNYKRLRKKLGKVAIVTTASLEVGLINMLQEIFEDWSNEKRTGGKVFYYLTALLYPKTKYAEKIGDYHRAIDARYSGYPNIKDALDRIIDAILDLQADRYVYDTNTLLPKLKAEVYGIVKDTRKDFEEEQRLIKRSEAAPIFITFSNTDGDIAPPPPGLSEYRRKRKEVRDSDPEIEAINTKKARVKFKINLSTQATLDFKNLSENNSLQDVFAQLVKTLDLLAQNPNYGSLRSHQAKKVVTEFGDKFWISYVNNGRANAWRIFWKYEKSDEDLPIVRILAIVNKNQYNDFF